MTSKMRSLYLEGYNYSVFDLTKHDKVQIQVMIDIYIYIYFSAMTPFKTLFEREREKIRTKNIIFL